MASTHVTLCGRVGRIVNHWRWRRWKFDQWTSWKVCWVTSYDVVINVLIIALWALVHNDVIIWESPSGAMLCAFCTRQHCLYRHYPMFKGLIFVGVSQDMAVSQTDYIIRQGLDYNFTAHNIKVCESVFKERRDLLYYWLCHTIWQANNPCRLNVIEGLLIDVMLCLNCPKLALQGLEYHCLNIRIYNLRNMWQWFEKHGNTVYC